jgi:tripartite-type tricarboxylate transporter receptor subunit TctC
MNRLPFYVCAAVLLGIPALLVAQTYPTKPVRIVVPLAPGGGVDITSRTVGAKMAEGLKQNVIIDNRPGGATVIGTEIVAKSPPDGYTLVMASSSHAIHGILHKLPFDPIKDFAGVSLVATAPLVLVVHPSVPVKTVKELVALAKKNPGKLNFGSSGNTSVLHLAGEMFNVMAGVKTVHIPYKGTGPALIDLIAGQIEMLFGTPVATFPHVRSGKLRSLAMTSAKRSQAVPELPTVAEAALPGFSAEAWYALLAPAGTPPAVIARLNAEAVKAVQHPDVKTRLGGEGAELIGAAPEQTMQFIQEEIVRWTKVIKTAGIKPE